jgi:hypothetical protein
MGMGYQAPNKFFLMMGFWHPLLWGPELVSCPPLATPLTIRRIAHILILLTFA